MYGQAKGVSRLRDVGGRMAPERNFRKTKFPGLTVVKKTTFLLPGNAHWFLLGFGIIKVLVFHFCHILK